MEARLQPQDSPCRIRDGHTGPTSPPPPPPHHHILPMSDTHLPFTQEMVNYNPQPNKGISYRIHETEKKNSFLNPLNAELNPIRHLLALVGGRHIVHVSRIRVE
jgi:hypothetical protein